MSVRCFKCLDDVAIVGTREGPKKSYCRTCFLDNYHKNVRDAFFRQCRIPPNTPVVLAVSGGINSMAMMHSLGLLRVQNITRGGAGKINFNMHVLHMTGDDYLSPSPSDTGKNTGTPDASAASSSSLHCARSVIKSCTAIAPIDHVPQATTTKRRVQEKKKQQQQQNGGGGEGGTAAPPAAVVHTTPLFESERVHIRKFADYLPPLDELNATFFSGVTNAATNGNSNGGAAAADTKPLTSVAMAEDLLYQLRMKAIVAAAKDVVAKLSSSSSSSAAAAVTAAEGEQRGEAGKINNDDVVINKHNDKAQREASSSPPFILLLGDSAVKSGVEALYQLIRGRGQSILDHCGYRGNLFGGQISVRRPMRSSLPKENLFYCRIEGLETMWTSVPIPSSAAADVNPQQTIWQLLQFCVASASVHRDLSHLLIQSIKKHYAGTHLALSAGGSKQRASIRSLLEGFVLNISAGSYRSAIFNILHSVDKMDGGGDAAVNTNNNNNNGAKNNSSNKDGGMIMGVHGRSQREQPRFGPKNADVFAAAIDESAEGGSGGDGSAIGSSSSPTTANHCTLCGGQCDVSVAEYNNTNKDLPHGTAEEGEVQSEKPPSTQWKWCRSCRQILRPIFDNAKIFGNGNHAPPTAATAAVGASSASSSEIGGMDQQQRSMTSNEVFSFLTRTAADFHQAAAATTTSIIIDGKNTDNDGDTTNVIRMSRAQIRAEIAEFLLDNDDDE